MQAERGAGERRGVPEPLPPHLQDPSIRPIWVHPFKQFVPDAVVQRLI
jgi:hypothetical protein